MPYLPAYARATWGVTLTSVERTYLEYPDGRTDEINILGQGHDAQGQPVAVVAECKLHPNLNDAKRFAALVARARRLLPGTVLPLLLGASIPPAMARAIAAQWPELHLAHTSAVRLAGGLAPGPAACHGGANFCT